MEQKKPANDEQTMDAVSPPAAPPPGWVPLVDPDGAHVRIHLSPTLTEDDLEWTGMDQATSKPAPSSLFRMPGDTMKGGYIATQPTLPPPQTPEDGGGYWSEVAKNAPGSLVGTAMGLSQYPTPLNAVSTLQFANRLATDPEFRNEVGTYYKNFLSPSGWAENFKNDPFGFSFDVISSVTPMKKGPRVPRPQALPKLKILSSDQLKHAGGTAINVAEKSGVFFDSEFITSLRKTMLGGEKAKKFRPDRDGAADINDVQKQLKELDDDAIGFDDLQDLNELLGSAWLKATRRGDKYHAAVAAEMQRTLNEHIEAVDKAGGQGMFAAGDMTPERAAEVYREGRQIYRQSMFAKEVEKIGKMADLDAVTNYERAGEATALRKHVKQLLKRHYKKGDTGMKPDEVAALERFAHINLTDKFLKLASRKLGTVAGGLIGQAVDQYIGLPGVGTTVGILAAETGKEAAKAAMDIRAIRQFNAFKDEVLIKGSQRLQGLIGEAMYAELYGKPETAKVAKTWTESIGTPAFTHATKAMAVAVASVARMNSKEAIDEIYARLIKMEDEVAMDVEGDDKGDKK